MKTKSQKFLDIFSMICAIVLFVGLLALSVFAVKLSIEQIENTCYADSSNGIVEDNILPLSDFRSIASISPWEYNYLDALLYTSNYTTLLAGTTQRFFVYRVSDADFLSRTITVSYQLYGEQYVSYTFTLNSSYDGQAVGVFTGVFYNNARFRLYHYNNNDLGFTLDIGANGENVNLVWFKVEFGSSFTGYVPNDYTNYGYDQGVVDGASNGFNLRNYITLFDFGEYTDLIGEFSFNGTSYSGRLLQPIQSFAPGSFSSVGVGQTSPGGHIGYKYVNDRLYGDIVIHFPWVDRRTVGSLVFVFERVDNGQCIYVDYRDTIHWSFDPVSIGRVRTQSGLTSDYSWIVYDAYIKIFFDSPVNLYIISNAPNSTDPPLSMNNDILTMYDAGCMLFIPNDPIYGIYATMSSNALDTFDEGFNAGVNSVDVSSYYNNGYNIGYNAGHRDGVLENTDYSFVGLIGAVFDAPVQAFSGLLDFNLLGVNLKSFVLALLSLSVIIIVIKIALGGS